MFYDMGATHTTATIVCKCFAIFLSDFSKLIYLPVHVFSSNSAIFLGSWYLYEVSSEIWSIINNSTWNQLVESEE